jgi:CrcB protein
MERFVWICVGGALGTGVRYLIAVGAGKLFGTSFPYGTLIVNLVGCFLIAGVMHVAFTTTLLPPKLWPILTTGFLGGLTTYSSFNFETTTLLQQRGYGFALLNFGLTTIGCFGAGLLGLLVARRLFES